MPFYYRRNDEPEYSPYLQHGFNWEWASHKYKDKRWINGAWRYLYELPKNAINYARQNGVQAAGKYAAQRIANKATNVANNAKQSYSNFRNYSSDVNARAADTENKKRIAEDKKKMAVESSKAADKEYKEHSATAAANTDAATKEQQRYDEYRAKLQKDLEEANAHNQSLVEAAKTNLSKQEKEKALYESSKASLQTELDSANAYHDELWSRIRNGGVVNQQEWRDTADRINAAEDGLAKLEKDHADTMKQLREEGQKTADATPEAQKRLKEINEALNRLETFHTGSQEAYNNAAKEAQDKANKAEFVRDNNDKGYFDNFNQINELNNQAADIAKEQESRRYKASQLLDRIINTAEEAADNASNWVNDKYNKANDWVTDQQEKFRESDAIASTSAMLEKLYNSSDSPAIKNAANFINQMIGWEDLSERPQLSPEGTETILTENIIPENIIRGNEVPSRSTGGRQYNGTSEKAERQGEGLGPSLKEYDDASNKYDKAINTWRHIMLNEGYNSPRAEKAHIRVKNAGDEVEKLYRARKSVGGKDVHSINERGIPGGGRKKLSYYKKTNSK